MKRKYLLISFMLVAVLAVVNTGKVNSHIAFPPAGSCGDPTTSIICPAAGVSTCAQCGCHGSPYHAVTAQSLSLQIGTDSSSLTTLDSAFQYVPGTTYYINFNVLLGGYVQGFQLTALNPNTSMAGSFTVASSSTEHILTGSPEYIGHLHAHNGVSSWLFQWTAPTTDSAVTFYYAFNSGDSADFAGGPTGSGIPDSNIFVGTTTITHAFGAGINNIAGSVTAVETYPNPAQGMFGLSFNVSKGGNASAMLYSIDGKLCKELLNENLSSGSFSRSFDVSSVAAGIYFVKLNINGGSVTKKLIIQ